MADLSRVEGSEEPSHASGRMSSEQRRRLLLPYRLERIGKRVLRLLGLDRGSRIRRLYEKEPYLDAYAAHTDLRVQDDPHQAVGGMWDTIGRVQFDFLKGLGLQPGDRMLDIGCGTLRAGRHFIRYLEREGYTGTDISEAALEAARALVRREGLAQKEPWLLRTHDLRFAEFEGETFAFLLAQSVFTHLPPEHIEECFEHVGRVMTPHAAFCFTYNRSPQFERTNVNGFRYPASFFRELAERHGFGVEDRTDDYPHPRRGGPDNQQMVVMTKSR